MDESTNYYHNYPQGSSPWPNDQKFGYLQPVTVPSVPPPVLIPVHRKIHINPSVLLSHHHHRKSFSETPPNSSNSWSPRAESRAPVRRNRNSRRSRNFRRNKRGTDRCNINKNLSKIASRQLTRLILGIRDEQRRAIRNDVDFDALMNRELSSREKVKRTVDARLWLQAKTALDTAQKIAEARDKKLENYKTIRLKTINKTFVDRGTSPIVFRSACEESVGGKIGNIKTEVEVLESDEDECKIMEIGSKTEDKLLRDDEDDCVVTSSQHVDLH